MSYPQRPSFLVSAEPSRDPADDVVRSHDADAEHVRGASSFAFGSLLHVSVSAADYHQELPGWQSRLRHLQERLRRGNRALIVLIEGPKAAGKGGALKRLTAPLDPRTTRVHSFGRTMEPANGVHDLRRFWEVMPARGEICVLDGSWYGRLIEARIGGHMELADWSKASREICDFERWLTDDGAILVKLYLHITESEQRTRLISQYLGSRTQWHVQRLAAQDTLQITNRPNARWKVIPADSKRFARLEVLRCVCAAADEHDRAA